MSVLSGMMHRVKKRERDRALVELYAPARAHLDAARAAAVELRSIWAAHEPGLFESHVEMDPDGSGRLFVTFDPPPRLSEPMEAATSRFFANLRSAMDNAVLATANHVCSIFGAADTATHSMPLCGTSAEFDSLVPAEALQGLRPDQVRVVRQFQPFARGSRARDLVGKHMTQLAAQLRDDRPEPRIAVWAHSARPELRVPRSVAVRELAATDDGVLIDSRLVATFRTEPAVSRHEVSCNPNIAFDLILNDPPWPDDPDDNLGRRLRAMTLIVQELIAALESSVTQPSLLQRIGSLDKRTPQGSSSMWIPVHFDNREDRAEAIKAVKSSDIRLGTHRGAQGTFTLLTLIDGKLVGRQFGEASVPNPSKPFGTAVEHASLEAAAVWGLPDFVFLPRAVSKGSGVREVGDGTIVSGPRGLALQVKARETVTTNAERERAWIAKKAKEGARQARGTIRTSLALPALRLTNLRDREVTIDGTVVRWMPVVILDHPDPPDDLRLSREQTDGALVLLRRDWEFLWDHLRSASAVVDYVFRVIDDAPEPLGEEAVRYMELAQADLHAEPSPNVPWATGLGAMNVSHPRLPNEPADARDEAAHTVFSTVLDDIARTDFTADESARLHVLGLIDRVPVADRAELGRLLLKRLDHCALAPTDQTWVQHRVMLLDRGSLHLVFSVMSVLTQRHQDMYANWLLLRREQLQEAAARDGQDLAWTVGVLLTPRPDGARLWDTTVIAISGPPSLEPTTRAQLEAAFPLAGSGQVVT